MNYYEPTSRAFSKSQPSSLAYWNPMTKCAVGTVLVSGGALLITGIVLFILMGYGATATALCITGGSVVGGGIAYSLFLAIKSPKAFSKPKQKPKKSVRKETPVAKTNLQIEHLGFVSELRLAGAVAANDAGALHPYALTILSNWAISSEAQGDKQQWSVNELADALGLSAFACKQAAARLQIEPIDDQFTLAQVKSVIEQIEGWIQ